MNKLAYSQTFVCEERRLKNYDSSNLHECATELAQTAQDFASKIKQKAESNLYFSTAISNVLYSC